MNKPFQSQCSHGLSLESCRAPRCREIWHLHQRSVSEERVDQWARQRAREDPPVDGDAETGDEITLQEKLTDEWYRNEYGGGSAYREGLPYDDITIRAMFQYKVITRRQADILEGFLEFTEENKRRDKAGEPRLKRGEIWQKIAFEVGCDERTIRRDFIKAGKLLSERKRDEAPEYPPSSIRIVKLTGEKKPRYYLTHQVQFRSQKKTWFERLTDHATIRRLLKDPSRKKVYVSAAPVRQSPMYQLFGELIRVFAEVQKNPESSPPTGVNPNDWKRNVQQARRLLVGKKHHSGPWNGLEVYKALGRNSKLCKACRAPLLKGFWLNGQKVTRRRQTCDDACKMRWERQKIQ